MLFDSKWQKYNYAGVYLPSFVAWLSTKPREERYDFTLSRDCAVAKYLQDIGYRRDESYVDFTSEDARWLRDLVSYMPIDPASTYGALHDRARALMESANG